MVFLQYSRIKGTVCAVPFFYWMIFIEKYVFNMKKVIRLTESDLHNIIKESVNRVLEGYKQLNGFDIPWDERKKLNDYDANGFMLNDEPNSMWNGQFSHKAESLNDYMNYMNKVNTDYDEKDREREINSSWDEIDKQGRGLAKNDSHLDDSSLFSKSYSSLKPEKNIRTIRDFRN